MDQSALRSDIILVGPIGAGKSTLSRLLAEALETPQISLDGLCWEYYKEIGFEEPNAGRNGSDGMIASRFNLYALERLLDDHRECVIDLGGGHSVHRDPTDLLRMRQMLEPFPNVFLLLPSPDRKVSATILAERNRNNRWLQTFLQEKGWNPNEFFLNHPSNATLARHTLYTEGKSPEQTRDEILPLLKSVPKRRGRDTRTKWKSEMLQKLAKIQEEVEEGRLRSLVFMTTLTNGDDECWSRIEAADQTCICDYLDALKEDMGCA